MFKLLYDMTTWKDKWTTGKDWRQNGETFGSRDSTPRTNGFAPQVRETYATESNKEEPGSHDPRERREDKGSTGMDNTANGLVMELDNDIGNRKTYECCGKVFETHQGLRIHQGKVCRKKGARERRSTDRQTESLIPPENNHSGNDSTQGQMNAEISIGERKPKVKWPKANQTAEYNRFDEEVNKRLMKAKGSTEEKLENLAKVIYEEGMKRFGPEKEQTEKKHTAKQTSRRQEKIKEVKKEKKRLRTQWLRARAEEKEGLKVLYEEIKKKHRQLLRHERRAER